MPKKYFKKFDLIQNAEFVFVLPKVFYFRIPHNFIIVILLNAIYKKLNEITDNLNICLMLSNIDPDLPYP